MSLLRRIPLIFLLRLLALGATVAAAVVMFTSRDSAEVFNMKFEAKYTDSPTSKYFVLVYTIASGYTLILLFFPTKSSCGHLIVVLDLIMLLLLVSCISANIAIGQVGKYGNSHAGWLAICGQVPKFCNHAAGAVAAGFVAALIYFVIVVYSLHNVFNLFTLKT